MPTINSTNRDANDDRNIMARNEIVEIRLPNIKRNRMKNFDHALSLRNANIEIAELIK
jgi:hypothetical protein